MICLPKIKTLTVVSGSVCSPPGHLSPRPVGLAMKNKMFRGNLQQDAQEFLRCLLTQIHDEIGTLVPEGSVACGCGHGSCDSTCSHRASRVSSTSHESDCSNSSNDSNTKLVGSTQSSPPSRRKSNQSLSSSSSRQKLHSSMHSQAQSSPKFSLRGRSSSAKSSTESIHKLGLQHSGSQSSLMSQLSKVHLQQKRQLHQEKPVLKWSEGDTFVVDLITRSVNVYHNSCITVPPPTAGEGAGNSEGTPVDQTTQISHSEYDGTSPSLRHDQGKEVAPLAVHEETSHSGDSEKATSKHQDLERVSESTSRHGSPTDSQTLKRPQQPPAVTIRESRRKGVLC